MNKEQVISKTVEFVKQELCDAEGGHDWFHIYRIWKLAKHIGQSEDVDMLVVQLGALLHDIADSKFHDGDEEIGPKVARDFLLSQAVDSDVIEHVENIIRHISFKGGAHEQGFKSSELDVVQDADRLDALGAIGVARCFSFGGHKNRKLHDPDEQPRMNMTKEEYKNHEGTCINHFHEKLFLLKDRMNTETGKKMAQARHDFLHVYLDHFLKEWEGEI